MCDAWQHLCLVLHLYWAFQISWPKSMLVEEDFLKSLFNFKFWHYKSLNIGLRTFIEFWISWFSSFFARLADFHPRSMPPCRFLPSPRPVPHIPARNDKNHLQQKILIHACFRWWWSQADGVSDPGPGLPREGLNGTTPWWETHFWPFLWQIF